MCGCVVLTQCVIQIGRLCATVCVQDPLRTPNAIQLDSMTLHSYIEQHAWTAGVCVGGGYIQVEVMHQILVVIYSC